MCLWCCSGSVLVLLCIGSGVALGMVLCVSGEGLDRFWFCSGSVLVLFLHCSGVALAWFWCSSGVVLVMVL